MTNAICFSCGAEKIGAFTLCPVCKATPSGEEQLAVSMALCEHLHSKQELIVLATAIHAHRKLVFAPEVLDHAREALKDKQLVARLGMVADCTQQQKPAQSKPPPTPAETETPHQKKLKVRADAPGLTALHRTAFGILGATTRDNRRRIVELAEDKSLTLDSEICTKARSDLSNPRNRLSAEVAWLPGLSPKRANAYCVLLRQDIDDFVYSADDENPLVRANLIAAALELFDPAIGVDDWAKWILELALEADKIDSTDVLRTINEDRAIAGFPEIQVLDAVEAEMSARRRYYKDTINEAMDRLPTAKMIQVITNVVETATGFGTEPAPILIDELIDSFEVGVRPFLDKEADNVRELVKSTHALAGVKLGGERVVKPLLDKLEQVVRNWDKVAKPIQMNRKMQGIEHEQSKALAYEIRSVGIDLFNKHGMLEQAQRVTNLLQEVFSELPEVVDRLNGDAKAIDNIFGEREQSKLQAEQWAKEITYEAEIGLIFKDTLRISPNGIEWKGNRYPLDSITRVRWGGVRRSINGIPTGTDYTIAFGNSRSEAVVQLRREEIYTTFLEKLWRAVCVRLMTQTLEALKAGKRVSFGGAVIDDNGVQLTKHKFLGNETVYCAWDQAHYWSADGSLVIGAKDDKKVYASISYLDTANAHILEAIIRLSFKKWKGRLSGLLED